MHQVLLYTTGSSRESRLEKELVNHFVAPPLENACWQVYDAREAYLPQDSQEPPVYCIFEYGTYHSTRCYVCFSHSLSLIYVSVHEVSGFSTIAPFTPAAAEL